MCCGCIQSDVEEGVEIVLNFVTVAVGLWMRQLEDNLILHTVVADNNYEDNHVALAIEECGKERIVDKFGIPEPSDWEVQQAQDFLLVFARMPYEWRVSAGAVQGRCVDYLSVLTPPSTDPAGVACD